MVNQRKIDDCVIDALVKIGNDENVIEMCEPHVIWSLPLQGWMVERTIKSIDLLQNEYEKWRDK